MISNCGHDENGKYTGGKAGDQTGTEWYTKAYSNYPYNVILRHPDPTIREMIADQAEKGAANDNIGYNQWDRYSFEDELIKAGDLVENIKTPCNSDCSEGVTAIVRAIGRRVGNDSLSNIDRKTYTGNMRKNFKNAGFQALTASKYFPNDDYHMRGDVILNDTHHVVVSLSNGKKVTPVTNQNESPKKTNEEIASEVYAGKWGNDPERSKNLLDAGYDPKTIQDIVNKKYFSKSSTSVSSPTTYKVVKVQTYLNVRATPNGKIVGKLKNNDTIYVSEIVNNWAKLDTGNYVSANYIQKV